MPDDRLLKAQHPGRPRLRLKSGKRHQPARCAKQPSGQGRRCSPILPTGVGGYEPQGRGLLSTPRQRQGGWPKSMPRYEPLTPGETLPTQPFLLLPPRAPATRSSGCYPAPFLSRQRVKQWIKPSLRHHLPAPADTKPVNPILPLSAKKALKIRLPPRRYWLGPSIRSTPRPLTHVQPDGLARRAKCCWRC